MPDGGPCLDTPLLQAYRPPVDGRSAPRVTIEGGPGRQLDSAAPDEIGVDPDDEGRWWQAPGRVRVAALSALLGFAAATAVAEWRHDARGGADGATLSVTAWAIESSDGGLGPVATKDGRLEIGMPFTLQNTGPREIALVSVQLSGSAVTTGNLRGQRLAPGEQARLVLVRPLDCGSGPQQGVPDVMAPHLTVRARTDAGERQVELRAAMSTWGLSDDLAGRMCGDLEPDEAFRTQLTYVRASAGVALLSLQVENASRRPLTVDRLQSAVPWMAVRLVDEQGRPLPLPLSLPAGDFSTPRSPGAFTPTETWGLEITVPDCGRAPRPYETSAFQEPSFAAEVDNGQGSTRVLFGHDIVVRELIRNACPS